MHQTTEYQSIDLFIMAHSFPGKMEGFYVEEGKR
jgi:hypothetical protein